jgi:hypothetical protein
VWSLKASHQIFEPPFLIPELRLLFDRQSEILGVRSVSGCDGNLILGAKLADCFGRIRCLVNPMIGSSVCRRYRMPSSLASENLAIQLDQFPGKIIAASASAFTRGDKSFAEPKSLPAVLTADECA